MSETREEKDMAAAVRRVSQRVSEVAGEDNGGGKGRRKLTES
jgi:hypothetical protein